jgi:SWI/SNF-related matrix-associated actin-dependent regulator 1 of chromatin subfamily A
VASNDPSHLHFDADLASTYPDNGVAATPGVYRKRAVPKNPTHVEEKMMTRRRSEKPTTETIYAVVVEGQTIVIRFPYQEEMIDSILEMIPSATWKDSNRSWVCSIVDAHGAMTFAKRWGLTALPELETVAREMSGRSRKNRVLSGLLEADSFPIPGIRGELRPYQFAGLNYMVINNRAIIADEMGLGKTIESLSAVQLQNALPCVVVCKSKLKGSWNDEIQQWLPKSKVTVLSGTKPYDFPQSDYVVLNYDIAYAWHEALIERGFNSLIVDESHLIKNGKRSFGCSRCGQTLRASTLKTCPKCKARNVTARRTYTVRRTDAVMQLSQSLPDTAPIYLLTGTPIENRPAELIRQLECIDRLGAFGGESSFSYRYCATNGKGATNSLELHRKLREICFLRRRKRDVWKDLPAEQFVPRFVEVSERSMSRYKEVERDVVEYFAQRAAEEARAQGSDVDKAAHQKREQLRRVADLVQLTGLRIVVGEAKRDAVVEWIKDFDEDTGGEEKLIVFGEHISLIDYLHQQFVDEAVKVRGGTADLEAQKNAIRFQKDPKVRKWIANLQASKEGFTLTSASNVVFSELPWSPTWLSQGLARAYGRANDPHGAIGYCLLVKGTVDEELWEMLDRKRLVVNAVTDGTQVPENHISVQEQLRLAWMERGKAFLRNA